MRTRGNFLSSTGTLEVYRSRESGGGHRHHESIQVPNLTGVSL